MFKDTLHPTVISYISTMLHNLPKRKATSMTFDQIRKNEAVLYPFALLKDRYVRSLEELSKRDDDLLYLVNHGERSALEERVLRGKLVTAGLKIQPGQIATHPNDAAECKDR